MAESPPQVSEDDLWEELSLGRTRRRGVRDSNVEIVRSLSDADMPRLMANVAPAGESPGQSPLVRLRYSHHHLARRLAQGDSIEDAAAATGYAPGTIRTLQDNASFKGLLAHYLTEVEVQHIETLERMKTVGLDLLERFHERVQDEGEDWTKREMMEGVEMLLVKPLRALIENRRGLPQSAPEGGVHIAVNFVQPEPSSAPPSPISEEATDAEFEG